MARGTWRAVVGGSLLGCALLLGSCTAPASDPLVESGAAPEAERPDPDEPSAEADPPTGQGQGGDRPDIVLVLVDDLSTELLATMRSARTMAARGASYRYAFVVDSLCCVSRASLFTGQYPHQTGVLTNSAAGSDPAAPQGGWSAYATYGNAARSFPVRLKRSGYTTGFVGKFLNEYEPGPDGAPPPPPAGWSGGAVVFGDAYDGWEFRSAALGEETFELQQHPAPPADASRAEKDRAYAGTVIGDMALDFIRRRQREERRGADEPWFLEVATYAAHNRTGGDGHYPGDPVFPPAFADRPGPGQPHGNCGLLDCRDLTVRDLPGFGDDRSDNAAVREDGSPASWRTNTPSLTEDGAVTSLRTRAQMLQSVDRMLEEILSTVDDDTYVMLTSDNGLHLGQHGLERSKGTPYDSDARVPLLVVGPGVAPGDRREVVNNIDLAPTFEELAGLRPSRTASGASLVPTFGDPASVRRDAAFLEHTQSPVAYGDPDQPFSGDTMNLVPGFVAVRTRDSLLARFDLDPDPAAEDLAWELYDYGEVGWERTNRWADPAYADRVASLTARLERFLTCRDHTRDDPVPRSCRRLTFR